MLWLTGLNPQMLAMVQRVSLGEVLGHDRMHFNLETAVAKYLGSQHEESSAAVISESGQTGERQ
jgi:hypothetical protein